MDEVVLRTLVIQFDGSVVEVFGGSGGDSVRQRGGCRMRRVRRWRIMRVTASRLVSFVTVAAIAGLALAPGTPVPAAGAPAQSWPQPRYDPAATGYNPRETQLSTGNVGELVTRATTPLGRPYSAAPPVVADGMVFVTGYYSTGGQPGEIEAFPETCGAPHGLSCKPAWKAFVSTDDSMGVTVADGKVFANTIAVNYRKETDHQKLWVFSMHCASGGATCSPLWTTTMPGYTDADEAPTVAGGTLYVPHGAIGHAFLDAFPVACSTGCQPTWRGQLVSGADAPAAVAGGFVYVPDYDGNLYAFKVGCASHDRVCTPAWAGNVGEGGPRGAAAAGGLVFIGSQNGNLYAFPARGCGGARTCLPVWTDHTRPGANILAEPAIGYGLVYITDYANGFLYAFPEHCATASCKPVWKAFLAAKELSDPAVANGVVYVTTGSPPPRVFLPISQHGALPARDGPSLRGQAASSPGVGIDAFSATCATGEVPARRCGRAAAAVITARAGRSLQAANCGALAARETARPTCTPSAFPCPNFRSGCGAKLARDGRAEGRGDRGHRRVPACPAPVGDVGSPVQRHLGQRDAGRQVRQA